MEMDTSVSDVLVAHSAGDGTRAGYRGSIVRLAAYLNVSEDEGERQMVLVDPDDGKLTVDVQKLLDTELEPFFKFLRYKQSKKDKDGNPAPVAHASLKTYRSAVMWMITQQKLALPPGLKARMGRVYKGLGNNDAKLREQGFGKVEQGKRPMPFELYSRLAMLTIGSSDKALRAAGTFLIFQWNTCSRSVNTAKIHRSHMSFPGDSLLTHFSRNKTDQMGSKPTHKSHIFANPIYPFLCPLLRLGLHLIEYATESQFLFDGNGQKRFSDSLKRLLQSPEIAERLTDLGFGVNDLGTHSLRKGAATFACGGSPQGVDIISVCIRANWKMGTVLERYIKHSAAGDCVAGRTLAGLPSVNEQFALLPPHFAPSDPDCLIAVKQLFPSFLVKEGGMLPILRICVAQFVYHRQYLRSIIHDDHPLIAIGFLRESSPLLQSLAAKVVSGLESPHIRATGVPAWVGLLLKHKETIENQHRQVEMLKGVVETQRAHTDIMTRVVSTNNSLISSNATHWNQMGVFCTDTLLPSVASAALLRGCADGEEPISPEEAGRLRAAYSKAALEITSLRQDGEQKRRDLRDLTARNERMKADMEKMIEELEEAKEHARQQVAGKRESRGKLRLPKSPRSREPPRKWRELRVRPLWLLHPKEHCGWLTGVVVQYHRTFHFPR